MKSAILLLLALAPYVQAQAIPTPERHFGHVMGADRHLVDWSSVVSYFDALAAASNKIVVRELGKSGEGRPLIAATISAPANLAHLDRYLDVQARLADPRKTSADEARQLARDGKAIVMITCSIHANEVGSTQSAVQLAYNLLTSDDAKVQNILNNVILLLVPSLNPDGVDIVTNWYRRTLGTPYEGTAPPQLFNKYTGHDNNRDWYVLSQPETRLTVLQLHNVWHPEIVYDVHQQGAYASRMFVPPWLDPIDPNIDPILVQESNAFGIGMASDLTAADRRGVVVNALYDLWAASRHYQFYHGGLRILSESASALLASPITIRPDQIQPSAPGYNPRQRSWNYLEPWDGGTWRLRDIVDDELVAMMSCLHQAALEREQLLWNFYTVEQRAVARHTPYAFVISRNQYDPGAARKMLELLNDGMVEIERGEDTFQANGKRYPPGSYVIRMQQPYSSYAKTLLERQRYPDLREYPGGPPRRPYDVTAQTLPLLFGVDTDTLDRPFEAPLQRVSSFNFRLTPPVPPSALAASDVETWREVNRIWNRNQSVWRDAGTGNFYSRSADDRIEVKRPRIGLYKSYIPEMDEGWTRWVFDQFGFKYDSVFNPDIEEGSLRQRFDVIVFPDQDENSITQGYSKGTMPEEYTGGLDERAAYNLKEFAQQGGTLIFLNRSCGYALQDLGGIEATNVVDRGIVYVPGSLLNVVLDTNHPLTYGLPQELSIWNEESPAWELKEGSRARVVARYPRARILASGYVSGQRLLQNRAALLDVPAGNGHILLFGMRPQYRAQSYQTFKLFFNALILGSSHFD